MSGWAGEHGLSPDADYSERASQMGSAHVVVDRAVALLTIQRRNSAPNVCFFPSANHPNDTFAPLLNMLS